VQETVDVNYKVVKFAEHMARNISFAKKGPSKNVLLTENGNQKPFAWYISSYIIEGLSTCYSSGRD
jgi:hypothetical protein